MKTVLSLLTFLLLASASIRAASDADVHIIKAKKVMIEAEVITIIAEAKTTITLIKDDYDPATEMARDTWRGRRATRVQVKADKATFIIKRPPQRSLEAVWQESLQAAKDLQEGKEVGRIGYYAPDICIKGNLVDSITGFGYLYKGK